MSTKFFNNAEQNTLFLKLKGIAAEMTAFDRFLAVAGYFRSSGYFKLRRELGDVKEIKILVGINIDDIFRRRNLTLLNFSDDQQAKETYAAAFKKDIVDARYDPEVEQGILQMCDDLVSGRLQMRIHEQKNLHAKFYLCLPQNHTPNTDGWVIMGSSNISDSGLGITRAPRYELNVALKDFDDVDYCHSEFKALWEQAVPLTAADIDSCKAQTYLGQQPTPYELYMKVLIDTFGDQVEDDFTIQLPDGVKDLKYQKDAVVQGYQMLMQHNGLFLADVVGLGKTMIATMIAKRFIEANGRDTNILVVYPPALEANWRETFRQFGIAKKAQFVTNGSLSKVLEGKDQYKDKEEFSLIIVDEAHGFRNDAAGKYNDLQKICKAPCTHPGLLRSTRKKVMLLSATPLNNQPEDLLNLLLLFQDSQRCTIDGVPSLKGFFAHYIDSYRDLMKARADRDVTAEVDKIYADIRSRVIDKVTVRRTRANIMNDPDYRRDIKEQGIVFPHIQPPRALEYKMAGDTSQLFYTTLAALCDEQNDPHITYARYRAVEFLTPERRARFPHAEQTAKSLANIYRVHMVKRLESSFHAFKRSLATLLRITNDMIAMMDANKVLIIPDLDVKGLQASGMEIDLIIDKALNKGHAMSEIVFAESDFMPGFRKTLEHDREVLTLLNQQWEKQTDDPKFHTFAQKLDHELMLPDINAEGRLVVFSESVDTLDHLYRCLTQQMGRTDVLEVTSLNRTEKQKVIRQNFDANYHDQQDRYRILLTSDVLAEGVNLHRSNVIINYDSPWNATRLMQRIGRVNRIGSKAPAIYNYLFYPSRQGDKEIQLYKNALIKLQGFHSAFGEDAQIYSTEEMVKQFELYDPNVKDAVDKKIMLLRELRELYNNDRKLYHKIKKMPMKSRVARATGQHKGTSVIFLSSSVKTEFYLAKGGEPQPIDFLEAVKYLKASPDELPAPFPQAETHYNQVNKAVARYADDYDKAADHQSINAKELDRSSLQALAFLRRVKQFCHDPQLEAHCNLLVAYIEKGVYAHLPQRLKLISKAYKNDRQQIQADQYKLQTQMEKLVDEFVSEEQDPQTGERNITPRIIISESFV